MEKTLPNIAVVTTFPNNMWAVYAHQMLLSFVKFWPQDIPLLIQLDDALLLEDINKIIRPQDACVTDRLNKHKEFIEKYSGKDDLQNYRKQAVRFCHKVFVLKRALDAAKEQKKVEAAPRYLIWLDADVITTSFPENLMDCLPNEGDAVSYLGRKDWDHSECGWLIFDLENKGDEIIEAMYKVYVDGTLFDMEQWHDSFVFDEIRKPYKCTNLTEGKPGLDIWEHSPMASWSKHYKGPLAKSQLIKNPLIAPQRVPMAVPGQNFVIQTRNAIPQEDIRNHIQENQKLIKNWLQECLPNDETIIVVSAGPLMVPEDILPEIEKGRKVVAVKHALEPLRKAGIKPWACILLDPRPHVIDFVKDADKDVLWFVASQVNPEVTKQLLDFGCEVWGYHASVGANEYEFTGKQPNAIIDGGSATATRGLYLLYHLGFRNFHLYGYDLSNPDKPNLDERDMVGNPKYLEFSFTIRDENIDIKRCFYSEPQLMAQFEEIKEIKRSGKMNLTAFGDGLVPFTFKYMDLSNLRKNKERCKIKKITYKRLFRCRKTQKNSLSLVWSRILRKIRHKQKVSNK